MQYAFAKQDSCLLPFVALDECLRPLQDTPTHEVWTELEAGPAANARLTFLNRAAVTNEIN